MFQKELLPLVQSTAATLLKPGVNALIASLNSNNAKAVDLNQ